MKNRFLMLLFGISFFGFAQDTLLVPIDSVEVDLPVVDSIEVTELEPGSVNVTSFRAY